MIHIRPHKTTSALLGTFLGTLALVLFCTPLLAQTYRWVDPASGRTMYSDIPPPGNATQVQKIPNTAGAGKKEVTFSTQQAAKNFPVLLYTGEDCDLCIKAREMLTKRGIPFEEKQVEKEADVAELKVLVGDAFIPSLKVGKQHVRGFDQEAYDKLLDMAGYPRSPGIGTPQ
ncbi:MAG: glutaredoxin family protein [Azovibrio sp.]